MSLEWPGGTLSLLVDLHHLLHPKEERRKPGSVVNSLAWPVPELDIVE